MKLAICLLLGCATVTVVGLYDHHQLTATEAPVFLVELTFYWVLLLIALIMARPRPQRTG